MTAHGYIKDPAAIYAESFARVRAAAALDGLPPDIVSVAMRLVHACGMPDLLDDFDYSTGAAASASAALAAGRPIFCDCEMVRSGITRRFLSAQNDIIVTLNDRQTSQLAATHKTTRSAAAVDLWGADVEGAVVAIGNAPTALFRLLEIIAEGGPKPAAILGFPVGFVGAAESKRALAENDAGLGFMVVHGTRGGSAMAAAAVNALALASKA
jgi:precorrin-8X/cobalt-precorrin-8 methylmutase